MSLNSAQIKLLDIFNTLSPLEQNLLHYLSMSDQYLSKAKLLEIVNSTEFIKLGHEKNTNPTITKILKNLTKEKMIEESPSNYFELNNSIQELIIRDAYTKGILPKLYPLVKKNMDSFLTTRSLLILERINLYAKIENLEDIQKKAQNRFYLEDVVDFDYIKIQALALVINPFDPKIMDQLNLSSNYLLLLVSLLVDKLIMNSEDVSEETDYFLDLLEKKSKDISLPIVSDIILLLLYQGKVEKAISLNKKFLTDSNKSNFLVNAILHFFENDFDKSIQSFEEYFKIYKKQYGKTIQSFRYPASIFYMFALMKKGSVDNFSKAIKFATKVTKDKHHLFQFEFLSLLHACKVAGGLETKPKKNEVIRSTDSTNVWGDFVFFLLIYWYFPNDYAEISKRLPKSIQLVKKAGFVWIEIQLLEIKSRLTDNKSSRLVELKKEYDYYSIVDIFSKKESWELALKALDNLFPDNQKITSQNPLHNKRMAWVFMYDIKNNKLLNIRPYEQSYNEKKGWTGGRPVSLEKLKLNVNKYDYLIPQDLKIIPYIKVYTSYFGATESFVQLHSMPQFIGHPNLYWEDGKNRFDLVEGEPELSITEENDNEIKISLHPFKPHSELNFTLELETPNRMKIFLFNREKERIGEIIGRSGLKIPKKEQERVLGIITKLSRSINIQSEIGGEGSQAKEVVSNSKPMVHIYPYTVGLRVTLFVRPFGNQGPYYKPGIGAKSIITDINGEKFKTNRNLPEEINESEKIKTLCPTLESIPIPEDLFEWIVEDPEMSLELLSEIQKLPQDIEIEWPEGEFLKIKNEISSSNFRLNIKKSKDWFSLDGDISVSQDEVFTMRSLLDLLDSSNTESRFIQLQDGNFLALTKHLKNQLKEIRSISNKGSEGLRFSPLASQLVEEFANEAGSVTSDKNWKSQIKKLDEIRKFQPKLPTTFQAELREYQREGFEWLARLAHWGVGACLADDMGLGKTIQSIALILTKAHLGPCLVVAPSSVCMNWHNEVMKYAPTLNTIQYGGKDREGLVKNLQPFDLVICSYGMIQQDGFIQAMESLNWQVVVLDEAQAIKNFTSKRAKAVMNLNAEFRLATTGTPIENHLGELWSLFRFLNPGLLGSLDEFNKKFAIPIEKFNDRDMKSGLKRIIQPFILRRMKNQVLNELPQKTDITIQVELSREEQTFYEALRLNALDKLTGSSEKPGQKHLQILAEIMKLRRACCSPSLIDSKLNITSSKLKAFQEILEELLENKHKTLIFSQFIDHLAIIKKHLEEKNISYQYLDGSTSMSERKKRVDAFQSGDGDVFLISLKAGGTGLNLTAADYVIHMDPWWNPAVEDQASDRAHRIGQKRPVTVYRLVTKSTIEEKIIDLHKNKRDLADSLLDEANVAGKISADELLNLLREQ